MITNLVASVIVSLVTNVTDVFPTHWEPIPCPDYKGGITSCTVMHGVNRPDSNPTTKTEVTKVERVTTVRFSLDGKTFESENREAVSESSKVFALTSKWEVNTNAIIGVISNSPFSAWNYK